VKSDLAAAKEIVCVSDYITIEIRAKLLGHLNAIEQAFNDLEQKHETELDAQEIRFMREYEKQTKKTL
jgi:hypothetical protein